MSAQEQVRNWLREIGPLQLDENGVASLTYDETIQMVIEAPNGSPVFHLYATVSTPPGEGREAFYELLLKKNFLTLETNGATFAINERTGEIVLCYSQPADNLDAQAFKNLVGSFIETVEKWQERLGAPEDAGGEEESDGAEEPAEFGIRV